ncbi:DUF1405 domain-containing protein [Paenibacillus sp. y28]|uniref:DUF1405 domain-containing protein n=1 Tax=Paenibacillus sp. y28 TaxID=3129110 RepID=UPI00301A6FD0
MRLSFWWSDLFLRSRVMLLLLLAVNLPGTVYGYIWYGDQLIDTSAEAPWWVLPFVPDSPTASLFFTMSLVLLLFQVRSSFLVNLIHAFGVITCVKYGVWAVAMIVFGWMQGDSMVWQQWMLIFSHLGMALQALLYLRFFQLKAVHYVLITGWMLLNDGMDYHGYMVFPRLPRVLWDDLGWIERLTIGLSILSTLLALWLQKYYRRRTV